MTQAEIEMAPVIKVCDACHIEKEIPFELIGAPPFGLVYCNECYQKTYGRQIREARERLEDNLFGPRIDGVRWSPNNCKLGPGFEGDTLGSLSRIFKRRHAT